MVELQPDEYSIKKLKAIMPFRFLSEERAEDLLDLSNVLRFGDGDTIIRQGDVNQSFYAILNGSVSVSVDRNGCEETSYISTLGEGEIFGEAGMFLKVPRTANVVASGDADLVTVSRKNLLHFIKYYPEDGNRVLMMIIFSLLRKLKASNQELAFERIQDSSQDDIDILVKDMLG
jgi:CRP/FNR family cyclic AMP-dependent transcriptional regulator